MQNLELDGTTLQLLPDAARATQTIRIEATPLGIHLAQMFGANQVEQDGYVTVPHTPEVDQRVMALIDVLIAIRYCHPALVQLRLTLMD